MQEKSYFEQLDDIATAFEKGETNECLVVNLSMEPLLKPIRHGLKSYLSMIHIVSIMAHLFCIHV